ncbi:MAG: hypothetical protein JWN02_1169 [Acidobacteria bacterium]|nr:hypothetical protein [Acidobacteriota bacterium]
MNRVRIIALFVFFLIAVAAARGAFSQPAPASATTTTATATSPVSSTGVSTPDAEQTRNEFRELLDRHPPQVGKVLKLDPTLFQNQSYLSTYPALAAFVAQHPEVVHSPAFYLEGVYIPGDLRPDTSAERVWRGAMEGFTIFLAFSLVASVLVWLVKTLIQHRRWSRVSKVQAEVHNKLMDRFSSNEELLTYIGTPAGKRFLESAPLAVETAQQTMSAPAGRILWSVQAGLVLAAAGAGLEYVSSSVNKDVAQPLSAFGVLGISVGIGFILSAIVSFLLSRRLGLWPASTAASAAGND